MAPLSLKIVMDEGAVTRKLKFASEMLVEDACAIIREKVVTADDGKEYALFLTSADEPISGVWLEPRRQLQYYMLRDGDSLLYLSKLRNIRITMLDGSLKTLKVDESRKVGDLMITICAKIGITNHDEYGLCQIEEDQESEEIKDKDKENKPSMGTLTLKRKGQQRERDAKMEQLSKKLKTDDNVQWLDQHRTLREQGVDPTVTFLLKRRLFFSDRNVDSRDPVQLNLLYVQTRDAILNGRHPVTESQAQDCKIRWIHMRDVNRRILRKSLNSKEKNVKFYKYHKDLAFMRPFYRELMETRKNNDFESDDHDDDINDDEITEQVDNNMDESDNSDDLDKHSKEILKRRIYRKLVDKKVKPQHKVTTDEPTASNFVIETPPSSDFDLNDPVDAFLLSIGATLKRLTPYYLNLAKSKIFSVVQEHELQMIVNPHHKEQNSDSKIAILRQDQSNVYFVSN